MEVKEENLISLVDTTGDNAAGHLQQQPAAPALSATKPQAMENLNQNAIDLGHIYKQCKNARATSQTIVTTNFGSEQGFTVDEPQKDRIGNLDNPTDPDVLKTFHGARISKGGRTVNECISVSFDPVLSIAWVAKKCTASRTVYR
jgi:hypothetical protein